MRNSVVPAVGGMLLAAWTAASAPAQAMLWEEPGPCDRECLKGIVDTYLEALVAQDPAAAPLADEIRYTENTELLDVGEGLWETASAVPTAFKIYVPDPVARHAGFIGMMEADGSPIQVALRLKVAGGDEIVEAEHMVVRNGRIHDIEAMGFSMPYMSGNGWSDLLALEAHVLTRDTLNSET